VLARGARDQCRRVILIYHSVGDGPWAISKKSFCLQMEWLRQATELTSAELLLAQGLGTRGLQVAITFDDGYVNLADVALPILRDLDAVASVFANTGCIGAGSERKPSNAALGHYPNEVFMSWEDMRVLSEAGWSIGSHGVRHIDLTLASEEIARQELATSKSMIENSISIPCTAFAYTWGKHTPELRRLVAETGYRYGFAGRHGALQAGGDPLAIPRINVSSEYTMSDFKAIVRGDWDYLGWIQRMRGL